MLRQPAGRVGPIRTTARLVVGAEVTTRIGRSRVGEDPRTISAPQCTPRSQCRRIRPAKASLGSSPWSRRRPYELGQVANCYVVRASGTAGEAVVVDPGADAAVSARRGADGARCVAILITHGHYDHLGGVADLAEGTGAPVHMAAAESDLLERPPEDFFPGRRRASVEPRGQARRRRALQLAGLAFETVSVPGHSPAHLAFASAVIFSGDVLFAGSVGRTDLPGSDWDELERSIGTLLERFRPRRPSTPDTGRRRRSETSSPRIRFATSAPSSAPREPVSRRRGARRTSHPPSSRPGSESSTSARSLRALRLPPHPDPGLRGHRALRAHAAGVGSDVVQKEMYTFTTGRRGR